MVLLIECCCKKILKHTMAQYMRSELEPYMPAAPMDSPADTHLQALKKERVPEAKGDC